MEEYVRNVIANTGHTGIEPQSKDDLWFYVRDANGTRSYSYSYKGTNAFWIVQFICDEANEDALKDIFYLWSEGVEIK